MNRDIKLILQCALVIALVIFGINKCSADEEDVKITQHLYDQAIKEIADGNRDFGCWVLRDALLASGKIDDGYETYTSIWAIGTKSCNWINNPSTVETSN